MRALVGSPNRVVALALGVVVGAYAVVAFVTARPILGALFLVAGALLVVAAARGSAAARRANIVVGTGWLVLGYAGLFLVGTDLNVLGLGALGEVGLFAGAVVHLAVGLGARRDVAALTP